MSSKSEGTEQDTSESDACSANIPVYLRSPPRELSGFKLFRFNLLESFENNLSRRNLIRLQRISKEFVKGNCFVRLTEALTMDFIARNTTIPVPRVLDVFTHKGTVFIVQENLREPVLERVWRRLSPEVQRSCIMQIKDYLDQLRALKPPHPERIQAIDGSGIMDPRLTRGQPWGPFENYDEFQQFLHHDSFRERPEQFPDVCESLSKVDAKKYKIVFSHGDFGPHNMILKDGKVFVIDWEMAGWLPEYWDYIRAHAARGQYTSWWNTFRESVDRYDEELQVQRSIARYIDTYL